MDLRYAVTLCQRMLAEMRGFTFTAKQLPKKVLLKTMLSLAAAPLAAILPEYLFHQRRKYRGSYWLVHATSAKKPYLLPLLHGTSRLNGARQDAWALRFINFER